MRPVARPRDLEIQGLLPWLRDGGPGGMGGPARSALKVRDDDGTGPITSGSGRMGSKDPVAIAGRIS
jgi:hypothetical protein